MVGALPHHLSRLIAAWSLTLVMSTSFHQAGVRQKGIALDQSEEFPSYLQPGVEFHVGDVTDLSLSRGSVDFAFASNLFRTFPRRISRVLAQLKTALAESGTLNILQPNYYYAYCEYFDDYTDRFIYTHTSICDFLKANGYEVIECRPRFLPLTVKSELPVLPLFDPAIPGASMEVAARKQMLIGAHPRKGPSRK